MPPKKLTIDEQLSKTLFEYVRAGETHSILIGYAVDTVGASDERLQQWCDDMVGYLIRAKEYEESKKVKKPAKRAVKSPKPKKSGS